MTDRITIVGNVGSDPAHQITQNGVAITRFSVATTHRWKNKESGQWEDKDTNWYNVSAFRQLADNTFASIKRGDPVIVRGRIVQRAWEAGGRTGTSTDLEAETVGLDLSWGTGSIQRRAKSDEAGQDAVDGVDDGTIAEQSSDVASDESPVPF